MLSRNYKTDAYIDAKQITMTMYKCTNERKLIHSNHKPKMLRYTNISHWIIIYVLRLHYIEADREKRWQYFMAHQTKKWRKFSLFLNKTNVLLVCMAKHDRIQLQYFSCLSQRFGFFWSFVRFNATSARHNSIVHVFKSTWNSMKWYKLVYEHSKIKQKSDAIVYQ